MPGHGLTHDRLMRLAAGPAAVLVVLLTVWHGTQTVLELRAAHRAHGEDLARRLALSAPRALEVPAGAQALHDLVETPEVLYAAVLDADGTLLWSYDAASTRAGDLFAAPLPADSPEELKLAGLTCKRVKIFGDMVLAILGKEEA